MIVLKILVYIVAIVYVVGLLDIIRRIIVTARKLKNKNKR